MSSVIDGFLWSLGSCTWDAFASCFMVAQVRFSVPPLVRARQNTLQNGSSMKAPHLPFDPGWEICDIRYTCGYPFRRGYP